MKTQMKQSDNQIETMLQQLPETANQAFAGLTAGPQLKAKIQLAASEPTKKRLSFQQLLVRVAPVACCLALGFFLLNNANTGKDSDIPTMIDQPVVLSHNTLGDGSAQGQLSGDLDGSDIVITTGNKGPSYRSIWAESNSNTFPLIGVNGRYYRLLTSPRNVPGKLLGDVVGTIEEFTTEPSLSSANAVISNTVATGKPVYAIEGMENTLVSAEVDGQMRLFQRVSFNHNARRGKETLQDTLQVEGRVVAMELTGVGIVSSESVCSELLDILFSCAQYEGSDDIVNSRQVLLLTLDNDLEVQLIVRNGSIAGCGIWSCDEFFDAFEDACN